VGRVLPGIEPVEAMMSRSKLDVLVLGVGLLLLVYGVEAQEQYTFFAPPEPLDLRVTGSGDQWVGARALGMGGAFLAVADDATAAFWNPAGLAQLSELTVEIGAEQQFFELERSISTSSGGQGLYQVCFAQTESTRATSSSMSPSFISLAYPYPIAEARLVIGLSAARTGTNGDELLFEMPGLESFAATYFIVEQPCSTTVPETYYKRYQAQLDAPEYELYSKDDTTSWSLAAAYNHRNRLLFGLSITYLRGTRELERTLRAATIEGRLVDPETGEDEAEAWIDGSNFRSSELWHADLDGLYGTLGVMYKSRTGKLTIAGTYRTAASLDVSYETWRGWEGEIQDASFSHGYLNPNAEERDDWYWQGTSDLELPATVAAGVAWRPRRRLKLAFDISTSNWQGTTLTIAGRGRFLYPSLAPMQRIAREPNGQPETDGGFESIDTGRQYRSRAFRLGAEYTRAYRSFSMPLRAGLFYEQAISGPSGFNQPEISGVAAGLGFHHRRFFLDAAVSYEQARASIEPGAEIDTEMPWFPNETLDTFSVQPSLTTTVISGRGLTARSYRLVISAGCTW
jgi:hypothetical protein